MASYHRVGRALIGDAVRYGRPETARAAVEVFRRGLAKWPDTPSMQNDLGAALVELAQVEPHRSAVVALTEAIDCFRAASRGVRAIRSKEKDAAILRFELNEITATSQRAGRTGNGEEIAHAGRRINELLPSLSPLLMPYAQELLGQVHMAEDNPSEAADAFRAAEKQLPKNDDEDRGRCLTNLAAAVARQGQLDPALAQLKRALRHQSRQEFPLAWGRTQSQIAHILLEQAVAQGSTGSIELFEQAMDASEVALATHQHIMSSRSGLSIWIGAANVFLGYGTRLVLRRDADPQPGIEQIERALTLYLELFPYLAPPDVRIGVSNLQVALELLARIAGNSEKEAAAAVGSRIEYALENADYSGDTVDPVLIFASVISGKIAPNMGNGEKQLISDIRSLLQASGLPEGEWPRVLQTALRHSSGQELTHRADQAGNGEPRAKMEVSDDWKTPERGDVRHSAEPVVATLKTKTRTYLTGDITEEELNDLGVVEKARTLENANRRTRIDTLSPAEAATLRRARKLMRIVRDRRLKQSPQP